MSTSYDNLVINRSFKLSSGASFLKGDATIELPLTSATLATTNTPQTLTNKTITGGVDKKT